MCALTTDESQTVNIDMPDFADDDHDQDASEKRKLNHQDTELETSKVLPDETQRAVSPTPSVQSYHPDNLTQDIEDSSDSTYRLNSVTTAVNASLVVNIALLFSKVVVFILTFSYAVIASLTDSFLDLLSQLIIFVTEHKVRQTKHKDHKYPVGKTRLEPVGILTVSVLMVMLSVTVIRESIQALVLGTHSVALSTLSAVLLSAVIFLKFCLWIYCRRFTHSPIARALAQDHINDVGSNVIALVVMVVAGYYPHLSWLDPAGAVVISFWIIWSWYLTGKDEVRKLVGRRASDESLDELRTICENHHPDADLDVLIGYHIGRNILVEVEMIMEKTTTLEMSHDVCIELQFQLEKFEYVERAFVHCDYMHRGYSEHKPPTLQLI
eukprot:20411_1